MRGYFWALWTENGGNRPELNSGHQKSLFEINVRNLKPFLKWIFRPLLFWKRLKTLLLIWKFPLFYFILCTISIFCILWSQLHAWSQILCILLHWIWPMVCLLRSRFGTHGPKFRGLGSHWFMRTWLMCHSSWILTTWERFNGHIEEDHGVLNPKSEKPTIIFLEGFDFLTVFG